MRNTDFQQELRLYLIILWTFLFKVNIKKINSLMFQYAFYAICSAYFCLSSNQIILLCLEYIALKSSYRYLQVILIGRNLKCLCLHLCQVSSPVGCAGFTRQGVRNEMLKVVLCQIGHRFLSTFRKFSHRNS